MARKTIQELTATTLPAVGTDLVPIARSTSPATKLALSALPVSDAVQTALNNKQPLDASLTSIANLSIEADKGIYATGADTFSTYDLPAFGRELTAANNPLSAQETLKLTTALTRVDRVSVYPYRTQSTLTWIELLRLVPGIQSFETVVGGTANTMTEQYVSEWTAAMAAKGLDIIGAYSGYFGYWFYERPSYPVDYDTGTQGEFWHDKMGGSGAYPNVQNFSPFEAILSAAEEAGRQVWVPLSRNGDSYFSVDLYNFRRTDFRPSSNLTLSALTVGSGRTITGSSGSTFIPSYVGRTITADAGGFSGKAIITGYVSGTEVTAQIVTAFSGNPTANNWRLNLTDLGEYGQATLTVSGSAPNLTMTAGAGYPFNAGHLNKTLASGGATMTVTGLSGSPSSGYYPAVTGTVTGGTFGASLATATWTVGDEFDVRYARCLEYSKTEAQELIDLYGDSPAFVGFYIPHEWDDMTTALEFLQELNFDPDGLRNYGKRIMTAISVPVDLPISATQSQWEAFGLRMAQSGVDVFNEQSVTGAGADYVTGAYGYKGSPVGPTGQFLTMTQIEAQSVRMRNARDYANAYLNAEGRQVEIWFGAENWTMDGPTYTNDYPYVAATAVADGVPENRVRTEIRWGNSFYDRTALYAGFGLFDPSGLSLQTRQSYHGRVDYRTRARAAWEEFASFIDTANAAFTYRSPEFVVKTTRLQMAAAQNIDSASEVVTIGSILPQMAASDIVVDSLSFALQDDDTPGTATTITAKARVTVGSTDYDGTEITLHVGAAPLGITINLPVPTAVRPLGETATLKAVFNRSTASDTFNALGWAIAREVIR